MPSVVPPNHTHILVIGGGPAGSYAAAALAREGFSVVLLEMAKFPRYHIGESLIPSVRHYLRFIDAEDKVAAYGFARKPGSAIKFNQFMREGYTDFVALGAENSAWNVTRAEFDHLLLQHAAAAGVRVFEQTRVVAVQFAPPHAQGQGPRAANAPPVHNGKPTPGRPRGASVAFDDDTPAAVGRPVSATYETAFGAQGEIAFDYVVDASGRAGILSTKYLKNRKFNESLRNVAVWGYWRGAGVYGRGTARENAPFFEALSDESGWAWFIPLHNGHTSVGVVMDQKQLGIRSRASSSASASAPATPSPTRPFFFSAASFSAPPPASASGSGSPPLSARTSSTLADRYLSLLDLAPGVRALIGAGTLVHVRAEGEGEDAGADGAGPAARSASDFSYSAGTYAGPGFRIVGDAGAFIDPFFSSGVHLAMTGGLAAAASVAASIRGDCSEAHAAEWHSHRVATSYTRFLVVVLSAYKQIRAQSTRVLADIDEDNFDRAFAFLRPVIQGGADMGARLSEDEVQRALDFCTHLFSPTTPEQHEAARVCLHAAGAAGAAGQHPLLDVRAPVVDARELAAMLRRLPGGGLAEREMKRVLDKVNARRVIHAEHGGGLHSMEAEPFGGLVVRLRRGALGLERCV